jgi:LAS superfamily LD-carboxypeptidase LdcB
MTPEQLTGKTRSHIKQFTELRFAVQPEVEAAFSEMRYQAGKDGFDLYPFSAFRDFNTQLKIWNMKFSGQRPLLSKEGSPLRIAELSENKLIESILFWSALPGASRHHWGTEIDIIDKTQLNDGYRVQLVPDEVKEGGIFHQLHCWLDQNMGRFGFFRPYAVYQGGFAAELWHLSYAPISQKALQEMMLELLYTTIAGADISGKLSILAKLPYLFEQFVQNISPPEESTKLDL